VEGEKGVGVRKGHGGGWREKGMRLREKIMGEEEGVRG